MPLKLPILFHIFRYILTLLCQKRPPLFTAVIRNFQQPRKSQPRFMKSQRGITGQSFNSYEVCLKPQAENEIYTKSRCNLNIQLSYAMVAP